MKKLDLIVDEDALKATIAEQETVQAYYDICKALESAGLDEKEAALLGGIEWMKQYLAKRRLI